MTRRFTNLDPAHRPHDAGAVFRWAVLDRLTGRRRVEPAGPPAPRVAPDLARVAAPDGPPRVTWIGHASFLVSLGDAHVAVDPVFSDRIGVVVPRHGAAGLRPRQVPRLRAILVTHNHYDHLDRPSLDALGPDVPTVVPRGLAARLRGWGRTDVRELDWWQTGTLGDVEATLVPARHWSRRFVGDTNRSHWGGYVVRRGGTAIYHAGDTAAFDGFAEIGRRFPGLAAALLPIGAYAPAWFMEHHHMNPEQAGDAFLTLGARCLVPMHWGAFKLTDEPLCEPPGRLRAWWSRRRPDGGRRLVVPRVGETVDVDG